MDIVAFKGIRLGSYLCRPLGLLPDTPLVYRRVPKEAIRRISR